MESESRFGVLERALSVLRAYLSVCEVVCPCSLVAVLFSLVPLGRPAHIIHFSLAEPSRASFATAVPLRGPLTNGDRRQTTNAYARNGVCSLTHCHGLTSFLLPVSRRLRGLLSISSSRDFTIIPWSLAVRSSTLSRSPYEFAEEKLECYTIGSSLGCIAGRNY